MARSTCTLVIRDDWTVSGRSRLDWKVSARLEPLGRSRLVPAPAHGVNTDSGAVHRKPRIGIIVVGSHRDCAQRSAATGEQTGRDASSCQTSKRQGETSVWPPGPTPSLQEAANYRRVLP